MFSSSIERENRPKYACLRPRFTFRCNRVALRSHDFTQECLPSHLASSIVTSTMQEFLTNTTITQLFLFISLVHDFMTHDQLNGSHWWNICGVLVDSNYCLDSMFVVMRLCHFPSAPPRLNIVCGIFLPPCGSDGVFHQITNVDNSNYSLVEPKVTGNGEK